MCVYMKVQFAFKGLTILESPMTIFWAINKFYMDINNSVWLVFVTLVFESDEPDTVKLH
jgi:hypothetical protein